MEIQNILLWYNFLQILLNMESTTTWTIIIVHTLILRAWNSYNSEEKYQESTNWVETDIFIMKFKCRGRNGLSCWKTYDQIWLQTLWDLGTWSCLFAFGSLWIIHWTNIKSFATGTIYIMHAYTLRACNTYNSENMNRVYNALTLFKSMAQSVGETEISSAKLNCRSRNGLSYWKHGVNLAANHGYYVTKAWALAVASLLAGSLLPENRSSTELHSRVNPLSLAAWHTVHYVYPTKHVLDSLVYLFNTDLHFRYLLCSLAPIAIVVDYIISYAWIILEISIFGYMFSS
jgi:hypothetical protein